MASAETPHPRHPGNIEHTFKLNDGRILKSLLDLYLIAPSFSDELFSHHVNAERNDFCRWIRDIFFDHALADKLQTATSKTAFVKMLHEHLALPLLVLNAGSSSLKFQLFLFPKKQCILKGMVDALHSARCSFEFSFGVGKGIAKATIPVNVKDHHEAVALVLQSILEHKIVQSKDEIVAVGHRVVHGGEKYKNPTIIDEEVIADIKTFGELAPLHNPANLAGILAVRKEMPHAANVAIFDTSFHSTIPEEAFMYGLPLELYQKFKIRKYGFHGINHQHLAKEAALLLKDKNNSKKFQIITCHLGNGSSITAIKNGKSIDTSMGFTPLDGVIMGTRSGGLDPDIILYLLKNKHYTVDELATVLNKKSGLYGISELSADFRDLRDAAQLGNEKAQLAIDMLAYRIALYVGSYMAILPDLEAIVFSGGIGQNSGMLRKKILDHFSHLLKIDAVKNRKNASVISKPGSKVKVLVIPANEELEIAEETWGLLLK